MLIINDTLGTYGGSITLIERLCTWAVMNNECIKVYCNDMSNKEIVTKLNRMNVTIECFDTYDSKALSLHIYEDLKQGDIQIVSFILNNYLSIEAVKKSHDLDFVNVIYSIHPATFYKGTGIKEGTFKSVILKRYKKTVQRINDNGAIIFMDQDNIESAEKYYGFSFNSPTVIRALPMICTPLGEDELRSKISKSYDKKIIFTSCRADFPFKGYLFGLIEDFAELAHKYPDVKLCVVCSGEQDDVQKVKTKIKGYDEYVRSRIEFHDWMKYEDLLELMSQAYLYIGMGTGVLDAAIKYVPSIAVRYNTYYNLADCILCDRPDYVVAEERCKSKALSLIEYLLSLDLVEYSKISKKCFEEVAKIYDIQSFFECIKGLEKKKSYLTGIDIFIHSINTVLNSFKRKKHYDVSNIKYEGGGITKMKVVILAGGLGTRISEESVLKPKPMIEIGNMPILWHIMKIYSSYGFNDFVICAGYKQHIIKEWFADYFLHTSDITFDYTGDENKMIIHNKRTEHWKVTVVDTGLKTETGGRVKRIKDYVGNEPFMLTYGDAVGDINIKELIEYHKQHGKIGTMTMYNFGQNKGVVEAGKDGLIKAFREKSKTDGDMINIGFMVFQPEIFNYIEGDSTSFENDPMEKLVAERQLAGYIHKGYWQCMDTLREKQQIEKLWESGNAPWKVWEE